MTQFTPPLPPLHQITPFIPNPSMNNKNNPRSSTTARPPWPVSSGFPTSKTTLGTTTTSSSFAGDANCMEQLLIHCANAIESNDVTLAQQILWVLNNIAPPDGDSNQRLACSFLKALTARAAKTGTCYKMLLEDDAPNNTTTTILHTHRFSVIELANFVDLTPWHRFGFTAANAAILEATEGFSVIHIVDLSLTHCMQIPTLIDAIASRHNHHNDVVSTTPPPPPPPLIKLTVADAANYTELVSLPLPPMLDLSYEELGCKLVNFARSRNVAMEFRVVPSSYTNGFASLIEHLRVQRLVCAAEALVINCHMMLHYIPDETLLSAIPDTDSIFDCNYSTSATASSLRALFLKAVRGLDPTLVVLVDEDADLTSNDLVCRLRSAFNYLWIPYDTVDTFLPRGSKQRQWYEADICWKIENVIAHEGVQRVERLESMGKWEHRMRIAGFQGVGFSEESVAEVKGMLDEHAAGWGLKKEDENIVLTWKGHNVVFASAWLPA